MTTETKRLQARYFVPIQGNYYHFINESALGL